MSFREGRDVQCTSETAVVTRLRPLVGEQRLSRRCYLVVFGGGVGLFRAKVAKSGFRVGWCFQDPAAASAAALEQRGGAVEDKDDAEANRRNQSLVDGPRP